MTNTMTTATIAPTNHLPDLPREVRDTIHRHLIPAELRVLVHTVQYIGSMHRLLQRKGLSSVISSCVEPVNYHEWQGLFRLHKTCKKLQEEVAEEFKLATKTNGTMVVLDIVHHPEDGEPWQCYWGEHIPQFRTVPDTFLHAFHGVEVSFPLLLRQFNDGEIGGTVAAGTETTCVFGVKVKISWRSGTLDCSLTWTALHDTEFKHLDAAQGSVEAVLSRWSAGTRQYDTWTELLNGLQEEIISIGGGLGRGWEIGDWDEAILALYEDDAIFDYFF